MESKESDEDFSGDRLCFGFFFFGLAPKARPLHQVVHNGGGWGLWGIYQKSSNLETTSIGFCELT